MSDGILTIRGIEALRTIKEKPKNWRAMVCHYLQFKEDWIIRQRMRGRDTWEQEIMFAKAVKLADELGIQWPVTIK